jgi:hypothetical protein
MAEIQTNCGILNPYDFRKSVEDFANEQLNVNGQSSPTFKTIPYFHQLVCRWAYNVPLKFNWVLMIEPSNISHLLSEIGDINAKYERGKRNEWKVEQGASETNLPDVQNVVGCIFAQGVVIPGETVGIDYAGVSGEGSKRGFINAPFINGRSNFEPLEVGFLETNQSFVDTFLRPWSILVAHRGLIAMPREYDIKATIKVHQLARNSTDKSAIIRKTFTFEDCAPINISSESLDYSPSGDFPKMQAKFSYNRYTVQSYDNTPDRNLIAMSQPAVNEAIANSAGLA